MKIHIIGICGTFMAGVALLARELGHEVTGCDQYVYPPMSTVLQDAGIAIVNGFDEAQLNDGFDCVLIGNAFSRGHPLVEAVLNRGIPYTSAPEWLGRHCLQQRHVLAVSGTHGKTTTSSFLAWVLLQAGLNPGYLIGGALSNGSLPAALGDSPFFVIEADEYDTAFFDKRSKFIHYRPQTLIINNVEFDHADIFPDLAAIQTQFHHLVRTVPGHGTIIRSAPSDSIDEILARGVWSSVVTCGNDAMWQARAMAADGSAFELWYQGQNLGMVQWQLFGVHNVSNALSAAAAAHAVGVTPEVIIDALQSFQGVKRRLEVVGCHNEVTLYDDFAHHPTAILGGVTSLRARVGESQRIVVMLQFGSRSMQLGLHQQELIAALSGADEVVLLNSPELSWDIHDWSKQLANNVSCYDSVDEIINEWGQALKPHDHVLMMSNKSFDGLHHRLYRRLQESEASST